MTSKYFFHAFIKGLNTEEGVQLADTVGAFEVHSWQIGEAAQLGCSMAGSGTGIRTQTKTDHPRGIAIWFSFGPGNRFYIVENHGQCQEPNGDIIWRNEDGTQGNDKELAA